jgi:hypothetical protein
MGSWSQLTIKSGTATNSDLPMDCYYRYNYTEMIYYQSEINSSGNISEIYFEYNGNTAWTETITIYLGHTTKTDFTTNTDWITSTSMSQVFNGNFVVTTTPGWVCITLDTPFFYNNSDNLVIGFYDYGSDYHSTGDDFYTISTHPNYRVIYYNNDTTDPDPSSPPTESIYYYIPNLQLSIVSPLPIDLVSFGVVKNKDVFEFEWVTNSEKNVKNYIIESTLDGKTFNVVGVIGGIGNSSHMKTHQYTKRLYFDTNIIYFRLKQTDWGGKTKKHNLVSLRFNKNKKIINKYNLLGVKINSKSNGIIIVEYDDGSYEKVYIPQ